LAAVYNRVDDIDLWVGGLAEDPLRGALVGPLFFAVLKQQFEVLRDGDGFWYQASLSPEELATVEGSALADVIRRNTGPGRRYRATCSTSRHRLGSESKKLVRTPSPEARGADHYLPISAMASIEPGGPGRRVAGPPGDAAAGGASGGRSKRAWSAVGAVMPGTILSRVVCRYRSPQDAQRPTLTLVLGNARGSTASPKRPH